MICFFSEHTLFTAPVAAMASFLISGHGKFVPLNVADKNIDVSADFSLFLIVLLKRLEVSTLCKSLFATCSFMSL